MKKLVYRICLRYKSRGFTGFLFEVRLQIRRLRWILESLFSDSIRLGFSMHKGILLLAKKDFSPGDKVYDVRVVYHHQYNCSWEAVPITDSLFVEAGMGTGFDNFINHSCSPNCYYKDSSLVALRGINVGEELTFDYNTLVWDEISYHGELKVDESFTCCCGSPKCVETVKGFRYLNSEDRAMRMPYISQYIEVKICQERRQFEQAHKAAQKVNNEHLKKYLRLNLVEKAKLR